MAPSHTNRTRNSRPPLAKPFAATLAVIEILAGVSRHVLRRPIPTLRAGNNRFEDHAGFLPNMAYYDNRSESHQHLKYRLTEIADQGGHCRLL
jgi:hypothetical protein